MKKIPLSIVKTWLFLAQAKEAKLAHAKLNAQQKIKLNYGTIELAQIYIEQQQDQDIEVVVI